MAHVAAAKETHSPVLDGTTRERAAFGRLKPITPEYPTLPIAEGFNWEAAMSGLDRGTWYLVVFRSLRTASADVQTLTEFDERAHGEALGGAGLLFYFQGQLNPRRECLSFCVWQRREQAQAAARLPLHQAAIGIVGQMYEHYRLERYWIEKESGSPAVRITRVTG